MTSFAACLRQALGRSLSIAGAGVCLALAACGSPEPAPQSPPPPAAEAPRAPVAENAADAAVVVFLGDSLTAGYGLEPDDALPEQVEAVWRARGIDAVAVNAGVSGDTTANGLARFDWSVTAAEPDLLVIALGANDFLMGVPPDVTRANLSAILEKAKSAGIPAVLVGLSPRGDIARGSRDAAFAAIYPELAAAFSVPYYPSLLEAIESDPSMLQSDGLHPTRDGIAVIAEPLAKFLEPVIAGLEKGAECADGANCRMP